MDLLKILIGLCMGLAIGYLIITSVASDQSIVKGPDSNIIKNKVFYDPQSGGYYKFTPYMVLSRGKHITAYS